MAQLNDPAAIDGRRAQRSVIPPIVLLLLFTRLALAAILDTVAVVIAAVIGASDPVRSAGGW